MYGDSSVCEISAPKQVGRKNAKYTTIHIYQSNVNFLHPDWYFVASKLHYYRFLLSVKNYQYDINFSVVCIDIKMLFAIYE